MCASAMLFKTSKSFDFVILPICIVQFTGSITIFGENWYFIWFESDTPKATYNSYLESYDFDNIGWKRCWYNWKLISKLVMVDLMTLKKLDLSMALVLVEGEAIWFFWAYGVVGLFHFQFLCLLYLHLWCSL